eukprot:CAMPEP_0185028382 /NCGR_PEP_ID=MMETSP1103-20130426/14005_1 /TAXON_ID=36769 /ORGANISM="Paraphysomonas bandaiensis, Strain Caron Lab Isolate" /LENGTH=1046 /DNA_ID=CAMNT_0027562775 /DNA_START=74 /DNA_END=3211 /DNA_ORIENTATION=+
MFFSRINAAVKFSAEQDKAENEVDKKEKKDQFTASIMKEVKEKERMLKHIRNLDPTNRPFPIKQYIMLCRRAEDIVQTETFNNAIFICILMAGILVGAQTYPSMENNTIINVLDKLILAAFSVEILLKVMSEGMNAINYWTGQEWHWNNFDFLIVVFSMPFIPVGNGQVAFLRLIRLMRLAKVFRKVPQLRMIMTGLMGGLKSIVYIVILLLLVFYLYAIAGIFFFRKNDPWHFRSLAISLTSLFRLSTLSNWAGMFYINYYGCAHYSDGLYVYSEDEVESDQLGAPLLCDNKARPALTMVYFVSFIFICSFSMLSLFVGAITVSMSESMNTMKEEKQKLKKLLRLKQAERTLDDKTNKDKRGRRSWALVEMAFSHGKVEIISEDNSQDHKIIQFYKWLSRKCEKLADTAMFQNFITFVIVMAGVQVGLSTDNAIENAIHHELVILDTIIRYIFTIEVAVKLIAEELTPWVYFNNNWNTFDFIVVVGSYVSGGGSIIVMLRLLRLLRVLKLMRMLPQLQVIVSALMSGFSSITFISVILLLFFYFFGIIAMILFSQNDPWHFGTLHMTMITLFQCSTLDNWTDILYINLYGCDVIGYDDFSHLCENPNPMFLITSLYFVVFILMGALVLLTLFIGVVATSMEEATEDQKQAESVDGRVATIAEEHDLDAHTVLLYREVFNAIDLNGGGVIDSNELRLGMKAAGRNDVTDKQFQKLWRSVDKDGSGGIDFAEFLSFMMALRNTHAEKIEDRLQNNEEDVSSRVAANTNMIAEQLYNCATGIGPLDTSVKMVELLKRTSTGRPSSAPRILNREYSSESPQNSCKMQGEPVQPRRSMSLLRDNSARKIHPVNSSPPPTSTFPGEDCISYFDEGKDISDCQRPLGRRSYDYIPVGATGNSSTSQDELTPTPGVLDTMPVPVDSATMQAADGVDDSHVLNPNQNISDEIVKPAGALVTTKNHLPDSVQLHIQPRSPGITSKSNPSSMATTHVNKVADFPSTLNTAIQDDRDDEVSMESYGDASKGVSYNSSRNNAGPSSRRVKTKKVVSKV